MLFAARPARIRMDIVSPFGVALATLTSDGRRSRLADLRDKTFFTGPAAACNIARLTTVPVPGHVLVDLLRGEAPVLKHETVRARRSRGTRTAGGRSASPSTREAREEIHLAPRPEDWSKPWEQQRMRVLDVRVVQQGYVLYHAELSDHASEPTAGPREDPDNLEPPIPPSGPVCDAEAAAPDPRRGARAGGRRALRLRAARLEPAAARGHLRSAGAAGDARRARHLRRVKRRRGSRRARP